MSRDDRARDLSREAEAARDLLAAIQADDDALAHDMIEGETGLFEAIDRALADIDECDVIAAGCKEKEAQFAARRKRAEDRQERLRGLIEQAMLVCDLRTAKRPSATLTVRDVPPKPIIAEESAIPARFWRQPDPVLDKKAINEAAKAGEDIPGVTLSNGSTSLTIRRA